MSLRSQVEPCDTSLVATGDVTWELIDGEMVLYVYGVMGRIRIAGDQLLNLRGLMQALEDQDGFAYGAD